jgi:hypothetical protein
MGNMRAGHIMSCGCLLKETHLKHGHKRRGAATRTYNIWSNMNKRCFDLNGPDYRHYGGRGITVCARWRTYQNFLDDMGEAPDGLSIERKDNDKGYYKRNCVWASHSDQMNNRRTTPYMTLCGKKIRVRDACARYQLNYASVKTIAARGRISHTEAFMNVLAWKMDRLGSQQSGMSRSL